MSFASHSGVFNPADMEILRRVFDQLCEERRLRPEDKEQRDDLAGEVLRMFERSVDETELMAMLRSGAAPRQRRSTGKAAA